MCCFQLAFLHHQSNGLALGVEVVDVVRSHLLEVFDGLGVGAFGLPDIAQIVVCLVHPVIGLQQLVEQRLGRVGSVQLQVQQGEGVQGLVVVGGHYGQQGELFSCFHQTLCLHQNAAIVEAQQAILRIGLYACRQHAHGVIDPAELQQQLRLQQHDAGRVAVAFPVFQQLRHGLFGAVTLLQQLDQAVVHRPAFGELGMQLQKTLDQLVARLGGQILCA